MNNIEKLWDRNSVAINEDDYDGADGIAEKVAGKSIMYKENFAAAITEYASLNRQGWTRVEDGLPDDFTKEVWGEDSEGKKYVVFYTKGKEVELSCLDDEELDYTEYNEKLGEEMLIAGWYESCEQRSGMYDIIYLPRKIIKWRY